MITEKQSKTVYVAKAIAVFLIVWAHMSIGENPLWAEYARISVCQIGVSVFFVISGFFYKRVPGDSRKFWMKKIKTILIPWFFFASLTLLVFVPDDAVLCCV